MRTAVLCKCQTLAELAFINEQYIEYTSFFLQIMHVQNTGLSKHFSQSDGGDAISSQQGHVSTVTANNLQWNTACA